MHQIVLNCDPTVLSGRQKGGYVWWKEEVKMAHKREAYNKSLQRKVGTE